MPLSRSKPSDMDQDGWIDRTLGRRRVVFRDGRRRSGSERPDPASPEEPESVAVNETRHDFGRSVWLASHRSGAFRHTAGEVARLATDVMATWNAGWAVSAGELRVGFPPPEREVDWALLHFTNWQERGLILVDREISLSILVHLLGDPTIDVGPLRTLSALEYSVIELIIEPLVELTTSQLLLGGGTRIVHVEGREAALSSATPDLTFLVLTVDTGAQQGNIEIGLPTITLQTFAEFVDRRQAGARSRTEGRYTPQAVRALGSVSLEALVRFDSFPVSAPGSEPTPARRCPTNGSPGASAADRRDRWQTAVSGRGGPAWRSPGGRSRRRRHPTIEGTAVTVKPPIASRHSVRWPGTATAAPWRVSPMAVLNDATEPLAQALSVRRLRARFN